MDYWGIEAGLHQRLDVSADEDRSRVRHRNAVWVSAMFRRISVSLFHALARAKHQTGQGYSLPDFHEEMGLEHQRRAFALVVSKKSTALERTMSCAVALGVSLLLFALDEGIWTNYTGSGIPDPVYYPFASGWTNFANKIHALGMKVGAYVNPGSISTPGGFPSVPWNQTSNFVYALASGGYLDYLKLEIALNETNAREHVEIVESAIQASGHPVFFNTDSLEIPPAYAVAEANSWRGTGDVVWGGSISDHSAFTSFLQHIDSAMAGRAFQGPGRWNDPDMHIAHWMTQVEGQAIFNMYCLLGAQIILTDQDITSHGSVYGYETNQSALAIALDSACLQGYPVGSNTSFSGSYYITLQVPPWQVIRH